MCLKQGTKLKILWIALKFTHKNMSGAGIILYKSVNKGKTLRFSESFIGMWTDPTVVVAVVHVPGPGAVWIHKNTCRVVLLPSREEIPP